MAVQGGPQQSPVIPSSLQGSPGVPGGPQQFLGDSLPLSTFFLFPGTQGLHLLEQVGSTQLAKAVITAPGQSQGQNTVLTEPSMSPNRSKTPAQ